MKVLAVLAALILLPSVLFAVPVVITWEWLLEDPLVTTFRYQVDGENADAWTVVDSSVTSYTQRGLDGTVPHTLYLQQSYDGVNFSESALSVAQPMFPVEPPVAQVAVQPAEVQPVAPEEVVEPQQIVAAASESQPAVAEQPAPVQEQPVVVSEQAVPVASTEPVAPVAEEVVPMPEQVAVSEPAAVEPQPVVQESAPVVEAPAPAPVVEAQPVVAEKAKSESRYHSTLTLGGNINFQDPALRTGTYSRYSLQAELGLQLNNLKTFNNSLGFGVDIGLAYSPYMNSYSWNTVGQDLLAFDFATPIDHLDHAVTISIAPMLNMEFGKTAFDLGVGGFFTYGPELADTDADHMVYGAFAKASLEYKFNKLFSLGVSGKYGLILSEGELSSFSSIPYFVQGSVYVGFSF